MDETYKQAMDAEAWAKALSDIGFHLQAQGFSAKLCVIGSVACMFDGAQSRTSIDCDVWLPGSNFNREALRNAVTKAGLLFDPKQEIVETPYLQMVSPGLVQVGHYDKPEDLSTSGTLTLSRPPIENLVASKLIRGSEKDIADIAGLMARHRSITPENVETILRTFPDASRRKAMENLVFIKVLQTAENIPDGLSDKGRGSHPRSRGIE